MNDHASDSALPFTLRRYRPGDEAAVCGLNECALRQVDAYLPGPWNSDLHDISAVYLQNGGEFLVGVVDGRIVAMGAFRRTDARRAEIKRMRVDPAYQGRGFGRILLRELEARAREMGYVILHLDTTTRQTTAIHLYHTHGYTQTGTRSFRDLEMLLFEKRIDGFAEGGGVDAAGREEGQRAGVDGSPAEKLTGDYTHNQEENDR